MGCGASIGLREEFSSFYGNYELGAALGKGSYGCVFIAKALYSQNSFAVKVQTSRKTAAQKIQHEAKIWKLCASHRNVVHFVQMCQEADIYYMVMEACQCSLFDRLINNPKWPWDDLTGDLFQLVAGLQHLHNHRVLHSDIKAENALYGGGDGRTLKLADFGLAVYITPEEGPLTRARGSRSYMAPEMLAGEGYAFPADMWSLGVLIYVILVGQFPIGQSKQTKSELTRQIVKVENEPARLMNLAGKLKRSIAADQGRLEMKRRFNSAPTTNSNHGSSSDFQRVIVPSSEEPLTGSAAQEDSLARHLCIQLKRMRVVEFMRTLLRRNPHARCTASEALQASIFTDPGQEEEEDESSELLIVNRRPLKRQKDGDKPSGADLKQASGDAENADTPQEEGPKRPDQTSKDISDQPSRGPTTAGKSTKPSQPDSPASPKEPQEESSASQSMPRDPQVVARPDSKVLTRRRSATGSNVDELGGASHQLLQVPNLGKARTLGNLAKAEDGGNPRSPSGCLELPSAPSPSQMILLAKPQEQPSPGESDKQSRKAHKGEEAKGTTGVASAPVLARSYPSDDMLSQGAAGDLSASRVSRMSSVKSVRSSMGVSMMSRDQSGFDLLHQLAANSGAAASSWALQESGILDSSSPTRPKNNSQRVRSMGSNRSFKSGNSGRSLGESDDHLSGLGPVGEGDEERTPRQLPPAPVGVVVEARIPEVEGPTPSRLQRRVSDTATAQAGANPRMPIKRRVSFDEVLYMQHVVPNQIPPSPNASNPHSSSSSDQA